LTSLPLTGPSCNERFSETSGGTRGMLRPMITTRLAILVTGALMVFGCTKPGSKSGAPAGGTARDPKAPVAKVGDQVITEADLAKESKAEVSRAEAQHLERVHQIREQTLEGLIDKRLIESKAKAEGLEGDPADRDRAQGHVRPGQGERTAPAGL
jgi:hypothetical protein